MGIETMRNVLETMKDTPLMFDGAMGTMIYAKGVFINTCYDEVCLTNPALIAEIHRDYVDAGADVIETNSFAANRIKLRAHGLAEKTVEINRASARLAREAAGDELLVAGSVGPCTKVGQLWNPDVADDIRDVYTEQIAALVEGGVDFIMLETFSCIDELRLAAEVARGQGVPVFANVVVDEQGETALGCKLESVVSILDADDNVDGMGINCGVGPAPATEAVERVLTHTSKPFVVMPNAGMPKDVDGRMIYLTSPEYFTEYAKRLIELGVRGVGGCCGTTPDHIRVAAKAIKSLSGVKKHVAIQAYAEEANDVEIIAPSEKSRFACRMLAGEKVTSIELTPPRSSDLTALLEKARQCHNHGVDAINIPDGPRASARVSPMISAIAIMREVGIDPILHYCCRDRNLIGMQSDLLGAYAAGLRNLLIITGDPPKLGDYPDVTGVFDVDAIGLTQVAANMNHGRDIGGSAIDPPTGLFIGVGANPVAVEMEREITRYHTKLEAGAEFAITQPVFDVDALFRFLDKVEDDKARIPVLAGVWPLTSFRNAEFMNNEVPGVVVPGEILDRMSRCQSKEDGVDTGVAIAREICEKIASRVDGFQVSAPFGRVDIALRALGRMD